MKYCYFLFIYLLLFCGCKENKKTSITNLVNEWQGKEILFPESPVFTLFGSDTTDFTIPESDFKVLVYVDPIGCVSCKLQLPKWQEFIAYTDSVTTKSVPFLFFFHTMDDKEIKYLLKLEQFDLPICLDKENQINKLNKFPSDPTFQTFLLDKDNKVLVIGNPIHNLAVKDLYLKQITGGKQDAEHEITTSAEVEQAEIDLGTINISETKEATYSIKNTGNQPLVIKEVSTTCSCATTSFEKQAVQNGESLTVTVKMTPKEAGIFNETIMVKCNTKQFIRLKLKGVAQ